MSNFIDIHNHILPNADDGSKSIEQSVNMIRIAYREGIRQIIATPHFFVNRFEKSPCELRDIYEALRDRIKKEVPDMKLYLGSEIMYTGDIAALITENKILSMNDSKYVLIEFMPSMAYREIKEGIQNIIFTGKVPILAHVERYQSVMQDIYRIDELKDLGAYIQVNAGSVIGNLGRKIKKYIKLLMKDEMVDFVATDSHSDGHRAPYMERCAEYIAKKFGDEYMERLLVSNPQKIIDNKYI